MDNIIHTGEKILIKGATGLAEAEVITGTLKGVGLTVRYWPMIDLTILSWARTKDEGFHIHYNDDLDEIMLSKGNIQLHFTRFACRDDNHIFVTDLQHHRADVARLYPNLSYLAHYNQ